MIRTRSARPPGTEMRSRLLKAALTLLDRNGGARGVNLRRICAKAGCAHPNAYNHFEGLDHLLWHVIPLALERLIAYTDKELASAPAGADAFDVFVACQIDFALQHPGWYRFIWLDQLQGAPPPEVIASIFEVQARFAEKLAATSGASLDRARAMAAADVVHTFIHGEACKLISGRRDFEQPVGRARQLLLARVRRIFELACSDPSLLRLDLCS